MTVEQLRQRVAKARQCVADLCEGRRRWTMTVPVDLDRDPDVIITDALRDVDALLDIAEAAQRHHYHVNDEWARLAAMRPQDPVPWERWEAIRERLLDELAAALSRLDDR